jgi:hypothetical protein
MKKLLFSLALILAAVSAYGQGRVAFINGSSTGITNGLTGQPISGAGNYYFGLYVGPVGTPVGSLTLNLLATNTALAGRLNGGSPAALAAPHADGSSYPLVFQIRGWSAAGGLSYEEAVLASQGNPNILLGVSAVGQVTPTFSPTAQAPLFGTSAGQVGGFVLGIPEPSSIALGLLGLGAIALFRRRK